MPFVAPKVRDDLEYFEQEIDGDDVVLVRCPLRSTYFKFNPLQTAMLQALDGHRSALEITAVLAEQYEVEIPAAAAERFIARARELMLLDITAYGATPPAARKQVRKALRKAGFRAGAASPVRRAPGTAAAAAALEAPVRALSPDAAQLAEAFRQLELGHPRAAAGHLAELLDRDPHNARARQLFDLIQGAYIRAAGGLSDVPTWVLFNPSRLLSWLSRTIGRLLFGWFGILAMLAYVCVGAYAYTLVSFDAVTAEPFDIVIAIATILVSGMLHEVGHGLACQHYGGNVTEIGFTLFYYVQPAAYCDTSSTYTITSRLHKMIVQLAGSTMSVLVISTNSIVLALLHPSVPVYPGLALGLVIASTLAFVSLIPFIKNDGYYAISDYFAFPNLRDRSFKLAKAWLSKHLLGMELPTEELAPRVRSWLIAYAIASFLFTALFIYLIYFRAMAPIVERFQGTGLAFAVLLTAYLLRNLMLRPIWDGARLLVRERARIFTRRRSIVFALVLAAVIGPWFIRWPVLIDNDFVLRPQHRADVRPLVAGRVGEVHVTEGARVTRGQPIATLRDPALRARIATLEAEREAASHYLALRRAGARSEELALARTRVALARSEVQHSARDAQLATALADASLGTRAAADVARGRAAVRTGEAGAAQGALALLEAGTRPEDIAAAEAELARLDAQLAHLRAEAELLVLRSPIDGVIATPHLEYKLQAQLAPGELFAEVHDLDAVIAEIALAPGDPLAELAIGDEIALMPHGAPGLELFTRVERLHESALETGGAKRIVVVTAPFTLPHALTGLSGHARIYGAERSLAYAYLYLPLQRLVRIDLWSLMW